MARGVCVTIPKIERDRRVESINERYGASDAVRAGSEPGSLSQARPNSRNGFDP